MGLSNTKTRVANSPESSAHTLRILNTLVENKSYTPALNTLIRGHVKTQ